MKKKKGAGRGEARVNVKMASTMRSKNGKKFTVPSNLWQWSLLSQIRNRGRVKSNSIHLWDLD